MAATTRYEITHVSRYVYSSPVRGCVMSLCLQPSDDPPQRLLEFEIDTAPLSSMNSETDCFGNTKHVINIHREHEALEIVARSEVETAAAPPPSGVLGADALGGDALLAQLVRALGLHALQRPDRPHGPVSATSWNAWTYEPPAIRSKPSPGSPTRSTAASNTCRASPPPRRRSTTSSRPAAGVCQDYAHVMLAIARSWGVPSRYVSGYVAVDKAGPAMASASHAWVECLLPGLGWTGFDPTNGQPPGDGHVRVAVGRDYQDVSPTRGVLLGGGESHLEVEVHMRPAAPATGTAGSY